MKSYKKYNNIRLEMLKMKYELKIEYRKTLQYIRFFSLLRYNRTGIAS
ncbi:MAG: hypothetical protein NO475_04030 [Candidatus Methanomethylicia archaeon]|jgi:hypothetical protein|nr:hypothetical protein [Candidatus Methanomethylicia archaeon]MCQ5340661.1 hypothetical protein [Candidatus Methanomethylicia archaeon]NHV45961.1 hypothetical protein [Candidatus Verstraetearchaeota archaeon]